MGSGRNAPCPCGSGKKHKHCCLGKADPKKRRQLLVILSGAVLIVTCSAAWVGWMSGFRSGAFVALLGAAGIGIYVAVRNPPKSRGRTGADRIDFGK